jgi:hypothetical protein
VNGVLVAVAIASAVVGAAVVVLVFVGPWERDGSPPDPGVPEYDERVPR